MLRESVFNPTLMNSVIGPMSCGETSKHDENGTEVSGEPAKSVYVPYDGWKDDITATLPTNLPGAKWRRVFDTSTEFEATNNHWHPATPVAGNTYKVATRSVVILVEEP